MINPWRTPRKRFLPAAVGKVMKGPRASTAPTERRPPGSLGPRAARPLPVQAEQSHSSDEDRTSARTHQHSRSRQERAGRPRSQAIALVLFGWLIAATTAHAQDPFIDTVVAFTPGTNAGFGADALPGIVLGPPRGAGELQGSFDVVSLGNNGVIIVGFDQPVICDGPGADLTVFENAFHNGSPSGPIFAEYGIVAVSQDGTNFFDLP